MSRISAALFRRVVVDFFRQLVVEAFFLVHGNGCRLRGCAACGGLGAGTGGAGEDGRRNLRFGLGRTSIGLLSFLLGLV